MSTKKQTLSERVAELEKLIAEMRNVAAAQGGKAVVPQEAPKALAAAAAGAEVVKSPKAASATVSKPVVKSEEGISPEVLVVIAAAVAHFMGKSVRIRSARLVHPAGSNPWAQQGRVFIQASHNLAMQR
jgi:hypothetical protein